MKYVEIQNFIKNNDLAVTHVYSDKLKSGKRRVSYCIYNNLTETQKNELIHFSKTTQLKEFKVTNSKYTPYFPRLYLRFTV